MEKDWISGLPDHVLEHVLSFLTLKEAVRTSVLSKRWRRMNISSVFSNLDFSNWFFQHPITKENSNIRKKNKRLIYVMDKILLQRIHGSNLGIEKVFLQFPRHQKVTGLKRRSLELKLDRWMKGVAKPGLTELSLKMFPFDEGYHDFPLLTFAAIQSLQKLTLMGCQFTSSSYGDIVWFSSLRTLCLSYVVLDPDVMQKLLKDIPLLENLEMDGCRGPKVLEVRHQQLKRVVVRNHKGLRKFVINIPKVEVLKLTRPKEAILVETCLPCLRKIKFEESGSSKLDTLVEFGGLKLPIDAWFTEFLPLCPLLEHLSINSCLMVHNINVSTSLQALKTLRLSRLKNMINIAIIAPNLETLYIAVGMDFPVVELHASNRLEVEIEFYVWTFFDDLWHDRLANFLGYFNHSRAVKLFFLDCLIPKKREGFPFPLYGTKCLEFTRRNSESTTSNRRLLWEYVDCMLWLSPHATNVAIREEDPYRKISTETVLELVYEKNETRGKNSSCACCEVLATKCWRHCLKEVKIQEFVGDEAEKANLKSWLWEEVENLSITDVSFNPNSIYGGKYTFYDQLFM